MVSVERPGPLTTLQDMGRQGSAHLGIGRAGAADLPALRLANALVGNPDGACVLEMTLAGPTLVFHEPGVVALTGAPLPAARVDNMPLPMWRACGIAAGARVKLGPMRVGCRSYLAIGGGIDVPPWRGSRSTDVNAGLGPWPRPVAAGDVLVTGNTARPSRTGPSSWSLDPRPWFCPDRPCRVWLLPGSHARMLDADSRNTLTSRDFSVGRDSNRVGMRLDGPTLALRQPLELVSEGIVPGVVQLPPDGRPIIMGCEHPVTGGYPRIAQVAAVDLPLLAQCRPGDAIRFAWLEPERALYKLDERETSLARLIERIHQRRQSA